jgi:hypothetical protein
MSDTTEDMECDAGALWCSECNEHFEECECDTNENWNYIDYF